MRRPIIASLFAIAFVFAGCVDPPPPPPKAPPPPPPPVTAEPTATAEPEPPRGDGTEASPYHLVAGRNQPVELTPPLLRTVGVALQERADLVLSWGGDGASPLEARGLTGNVKCDKSPCVVPVAPSGEYELYVGSGPKQTISASALALPTATPLKVGKAVVLKPKPVAEGDPRGAIADAAIQFDTSGPRSIDLRPLGKKRAGDLDGLLRKVHVHLYGNYGPVRLETALSPEVGGAIRVSFDAPAGPYTMRLTRETDDMADAVEVKLKKDTETTPGLGGIRSPPPREGFQKLTVGAKVDVEVAPPEAPRVAYFDLPPNNDLAVLRSDAGPSVTMSTEWSGNSRSRTCFQQFKVCSLFWPHPGLYKVFAPAQAPALTGMVDVVLLPRPKLAGPLSAGAKMDVTTESLAPVDPRGAIAEIGLDVPSAGLYKVVVRLLGASPPEASTKGTPWGPELEIFGPDATEQLHIVEQTTTLDATKRTATMSLKPTKAGLHVLRVGVEGAAGMEPAAARPRKASVEFTVSAPVSSN